MSVDGENDLEPRVVVFGLKDHPEILEGIIFHLKVIGIGCISLPSIGIDDNLGIHQSFADIKLPNDYILKEGFEDFQRTYPTYGPGLVTSLFKNLVDSRSPDWLKYWETQFNDAGKILEYVPQPSPGIVVKPRRELGIGPYIPKGGESLPGIEFSTLRLAVGYAIQAGSIAEVSRTTEDLNRHDKVFRAMGDTLLENFKSAA